MVSTDVASEALSGNWLLYETGPWEIDLAERELRREDAPVILGGRAFEILTILVRSAGRVVTKDEIMTGVWPGAIVEENTLQVHISAIRKALDGDRGMLKTASGRGYRLAGDWRVRQRSASTAPSPLLSAAGSARSHPTNLPAATSELIGRDAALRYLRDLLSAHRAVTLTGPGGIGKTALALEVARVLAPDFDDDCWVVDLSVLADPVLFPSAIAGVLGLRLGPGAITAQSIAHAVGKRRFLLILDNCEHVIDAAAGFAETFVRQCSRSSILATSREVLRIEGEHVYRVPPLDLPLPDRLDSAALLRSSAVQLFVSRTRALNDEFLPHEENLAPIAAICRRLDGIPLAIEFAAARASTLGISQTASRLDDLFTLLAGGRRTALPRHQTLRAALDWSYQLLPDAEQRLLRRLAIFSGEFTLDAAIAVAGDRGSTTSEVTEGISNLVAKSLVSLDGSAPTSRWRLLETIRAFAMNKLKDCDEVAAAAARHAEYYLAVFQGSEDAWATLPLPEWLNVYGRQIDNLRAALDWAFSPEGDPSCAIALTISAAPLWFQLSLGDECRSRVTLALARLSEVECDDRMRMRLLAISGWRAVELGGTHFANRVQAQSSLLDLAGRVGDLDHQVFALWGLSGNFITHGDVTQALVYARKFRETAALSGDPVYQAEGDRMLAVCLFNAGEIARARESVDRFRARTHASARRAELIHRRMEEYQVDRSLMAMILFQEGLLDQTIAVGVDNFEFVRRTGHVMSQVILLCQSTCLTAIYIGDLARSEIFVGQLAELARSYSAAWASHARLYEGMLMNLRGKRTEGLAALTEAIEDLRDVEHAQYFPLFISNLAERLAEDGAFAEALAAIDEATRRAEVTGHYWCLPEFSRIRGHIALLAGRMSEAEDHLERAVFAARRNGALFWELRAARNLAELRRAQGRGSEGWELLSAVCARFTEGFQSADFREARKLLDNLTE